MKFILELTNDCNLRCEMCPRKYIDMAIGYMSKDLWRCIVSTLPAGSTILPFWRGEPTLHPDFYKMMKSLDGHEVVIATNGTNPDQILEARKYLSTVNVSIHGKDSYNGYLKIKKYGNGMEVIASTVEGEKRFVTPDRTYKRHTVDGVWGKVNGMKSIPHDSCVRLKESVTAWNGDIGRCCYVWDTSASPEVCSTCDQWQGDGRTL